MPRGRKKKTDDATVFTQPVSDTPTHVETAPPAEDAPVVAELVATVPPEDPAAKMQEPVGEAAAAQASPAFPDPSKPFEIARHAAAGLRLYKHSKFKQVQLKFEREVPPEIQHELEAGHWRYRPEEGVYTKQYDFSGEGASIVEARRLYGALCNRLAPAGHGRG